jgi:endonuclease/exonuclease/phosphatase family metal-dependent hydrolase
MSVGQDSAPAVPLRVLTYNIRSGTDVLGRRRLSEQAAVVRDAEPDVVLLQEVASERQAESVARAAGLDHVAFGAARPSASGGFGNAVLSRFALREVVNSRLPPGQVPGQARAVLGVTLACETGATRVLTTHFGLLPGEPDAGARAVVQLVESLGGPLILGGDLNRPAGWAGCHRALRRVLDDAARSVARAAPGPTFPSPTPLMRLDYVYVRGVSVRGVRVIRSTASDHRPLVADLTLHQSPVQRRE